MLNNSEVKVKMVLCILSNGLKEMQMVLQWTQERDASLKGLAWKG